MSLGPLKTGNDYKFNPDNFRLREGETHFSLAKLNKIEVRYDTRVGAPDYPAMKSLYKWRSVFGYHLGGILRQAVVKLSEIPRHFANAYNFHSNRGEYERFYSTRDVVAALKKESGGGSSMLKNLKYMTWKEIPASVHERTANNDYSVRKLMTDGIKTLANGGRPDNSGDFDPSVLGGKDGLITAEDLKRYQAIDKKEHSAGGQIARFFRGALHIDEMKEGLSKIKFRMELRSMNLKEAMDEVKDRKETRNERVKDAQLYYGEKAAKSIKGESSIKIFFQTLIQSAQKNDARFQAEFGTLVKEEKPLDPALRKNLESMSFSSNGEDKALPDLPKKQPKTE